MNISYNWLKDLIDLDLTAEETAAAVISPQYFGKYLPILQKKNPSGIGGGKRVMGHHQYGRRKALIHIADGIQQHLGGMAVQSARWFIRQDEPGPVNHGSGTGAALLLSP